MAYRFKKGFENAQIGVKGWKQNIDQAHLTDDVAELILKVYPDAPIEKGSPLPDYKKPSAVIIDTSKKDIPGGTDQDKKGPSTPASEKDLN